MISVIIPTYNYARYISATVESVLQQTFSDFEIIIVDDGSTDDTNEVLQRISDPRIRYFHQENSGANVARNNGIRQSSGEHVLFLDSDDILPPELLESYIAVSSRHPDSNIYGPWAKGWFEGDKFRIDFAKGKCPGDDLLEHWLGNWWVQTSCILWTRKNLQLTGQWDETLHANQDGDMAMRALLAGVKFVYAENAPGVLITMHNSGQKSISHTKTRKTHESRARVLEKVEKSLTENNNFARKYRRAMAIQYLYLSQQTLNQHPDLYIKYFRKFRRFNGFQKPPGSHLNWLFVTVFGLRAKEKISDLFSRTVPRRS